MQGACTAGGAATCRRLLVWGLQTAGAPARVSGGGSGGGGQSGSCGCCKSSPPLLSMHSWLHLIARERSTEACESGRTCPPLALSDDLRESPGAALAGVKSCAGVGECVGAARRTGLARSGNLAAPPSCPPRPRDASCDAAACRGGLKRVCQSVCFTGCCAGQCGGSKGAGSGGADSSSVEGSGEQR